MPSRGSNATFPAVCVTLLPIAVAAFLFLGLSAVYGKDGSPANTTTPPPAIDFSADVLPILAQQCFPCHGPDGAKRRAGLRLDQLDSDDLAEVVVPGSPKQSDLIQRIRHHDPEELMPPPDSGYALSEAQIQTLERWIESGAVSTKHWAYQPIRPGSELAAGDTDASSIIDALIGDQLNRRGLTANPPAERSALVRRVYLDLIGVPPTPAQLDAFMVKTEPAAYASLVDTLLASPQFGEHWASWWLDAARYADSSGYQRDLRRDMWPYRDWVIGAINADMPFDQFTTEQLAGDLLPDPTDVQRVATAFHRNTLTNSEDGVDPEEFRVAAVQDRVNTTMAAWMGVTMSCAQCHTHKYDPITHREYYELFAFFNQTADENREDEQPTLRTPTPAQGNAWQQRLDEEQQATAALQNLAKTHAGQIKSWLAQHSKQRPAAAVIPKPVASAVIADQTIESAGFRWQTDRPQFSPSPAGRGVVFDETGYLAWEGERAVGNFEIEEPFSTSAWIKPDSVHGSSYITTCAVQNDQAGPIPRGWALMLRQGKPLFQLTGGQPGNRITVETEAPTVVNGLWTHVAATYDGSGSASGIRLYVDGLEMPVAILADRFNAELSGDAQLQAGRRDGTVSSKFIGAIADLAVYDAALEPAAVRAVVDQALGHALTAEAEPTGSTPVSLLVRLAMCDVSPATADAWAAWRQARFRLDDTERLLPDLPIMIERNADQKRATHRLVRGDFLRPAQAVEPGTPAVFPPFDSAWPRNRLGLAKWLTDANNPLTARVQVNRVWEQLMGRGLVETVEDFGIRGTAPTHPQLLDELAYGFMTDGWSLKQLIRRIVLSETYQRSTNVTKKLLEADPGNTTYARMSRLRLPAEVVRDSAMSASGLLSDTIGGPPFTPTLPTGHERISAAPKDAAALAEVDVPHRRSIYAVRQRSVSLASFDAFDTPDRNTCVMRRRRSNTPIQALVTLNDPEFVQAARALADLAWRTQQGNPTAAVADLHLRAIGRQPTSQEQAVLFGLYAEAAKQYENDVESARKVLGNETTAKVQAGSPQTTKVKPIHAQRAAMTVVANTVLSTDAFLTRP